MRNYLKRFTDDELKYAIEQSSNYKNCLEKLDLKKSTCQKYLKKFIKENPRSELNKKYLKEISDDYRLMIIDKVERYEHKLEQLNKTIEINNIPNTNAEIDPITFLIDNLFSTIDLFVFPPNINPAKSQPQTAIAGVSTEIKPCA